MVNVVLESWRMVVNGVGGAVGDQSWIEWDLGNWIGSWQLDGILAIG